MNQIKPPIDYRSDNQIKPPIDYRSAKTGRFVTKDFANHHPATTVAEHNRLVKSKN